MEHCNTRLSYVGHIERKLGIIHREVGKWRKNCFRDIFKQKKDIKCKLKRKMKSGDLSITTHKEEEAWRRKSNMVVGREEFF